MPIPQLRFECRTISVSRDGVLKTIVLQSDGVLFPKDRMKVQKENLAGSRQCKPEYRRRTEGRWNTKRLTCSLHPIYAYGKCLFAYPEEIGPIVNSAEIGTVTRTKFSKKAHGNVFNGNIIFPVYMQNIEKIIPRLQMRF